MADDGLAVAPVQVCPLDDVVLGVHPVHAAAGVIDGEAVGPEQVRVCDDPSVGAVHVGVLDARRVAPVRPVDLTEGGKVGQTRLVYLFTPAGAKLFERNEPILVASAEVER